jgi:hypothetical protein
MVNIEEAQERIAPLRPLIIQAHETATARLTELVTEHTHLALPLDAAAKFKFIHCHVVQEITVLVQDVAGVEPNDDLKFFALAIKPNILLRFKSVAGGAPRNYKTTQQDLLAQQQFKQGALDDLVSNSVFGVQPTVLTCGYTLDGTSLKHVEIRRDLKNSPTWLFDIYGGESVIAPVPLDNQLDPITPATVTSKSGKSSDAAKKSG